MSWHFLERWLEKANQHSTLIGKFWITFLIVCRMIVIGSLGDRVYADEQSEFRCNTAQPGCNNVCFNNFSPISHLRFWGFQIIVVTLPSIIFLIYSGHKAKQKLDFEKEKNLKDKQDKVTARLSKKLTQLNNENKLLKNAQIIQNAQLNQQLNHPIQPMGTLGALISNFNKNATGVLQAKRRQSSGERVFSDSGSLRRERPSLIRRFSESKYNPARKFGLTRSTSSWEQAPEMTPEPEKQPKPAVTAGRLSTLVSVAELSTRTPSPKTVTQSFVQGNINNITFEIQPMTAVNKLLEQSQKTPITGLKRQYSSTFSFQQTVDAVNTCANFSSDFETVASVGLANQFHPPHQSSRNPNQNNNNNTLLGSAAQPSYNLGEVDRISHLKTKRVSSIMPAISKTTHRETTDETLRNMISMFVPKPIAETNVAAQHISQTSPPINPRIVMDKTVTQHG